MIDTEKRATVLRFSLKLETLTSQILSYLLDIEDSAESYSFGNASSSLSFNQKINLLIDNKSITKEEKSKLTAFASIRNQFMHNIEANTFVEAFDHLKGLEKKVRKLYPQNFSTDTELEDSLQYCVRDLYKDGVLILTSDKGGIGGKMDIEANATVYTNLYKKLESSVTTCFSKFLEAVEKHDTETIDKSNLINVIKLIRINIFLKVDTESDKIDTILDLLND